MEEGHDAIGELAQSFNGMAGRIQELFEQREQLLQAVSHEIGTPLARVRFHLEALEDARDDAARMKRVAAVDKELREIDRLAIELTSWVEANRKAPDRVSVDLSGMLRETAEHEGRGTVQLVVEIPPEPLRAVVDPVQIQRAIDNVVRNALRYAKSRVVLSARPVEGGCRIEIRDDGPGIPAADRRRVLEPFARLEPSRSRAHGGMGLGLAITHRIVVAHGGSLTIETAPEGGAAIVMTLSSAG
jgi:two-component system sensor histidine kinase RstB